MEGTPRRFDLPTIEAETRPFWEAAKAGRLLLGRCIACRNIYYYPRSMCPVCWSDEVDLVEASGRGSVYTYSIVHVNDLAPFNERVPYVVAQVDLLEGPRMSTNIVDWTHARLRIGMPVQLRFLTVSEDVVLPVFAPASKLGHAMDGALWS